MSDQLQYLAPVELNDVMRAVTVGVVEESKCPGFKAGDQVGGMGNLQDFFVSSPEGLNKVDSDVKPEEFLSIYGMIIGLTAYHGVMKICQPKAGETFVVSGGAGAVGSLAGQLAKSLGARVIGVVGSPAKAEWVTKELGFDAAINYRTDDIAAKLKELAPEGVDCYFENTGGAVTDAVLNAFNNGARMALCGLIDSYNKSGSAAPKTYPMILHRRVTVKGFICIDHADEMEEMVSTMKKLKSQGKIKHKVDIREGIHEYVDTVNCLFTGKHEGKLLLTP